MGPRVIKRRMCSIVTPEAQAQMPTSNPNPNFPPNPNPNPQCGRGRSQPYMYSLADVTKRTAFWFPLTARVQLVHPGVVRAGRARRRACERRATAAGWQVPAEPTMPRLNSQVLGF